jgi:hypothetical protein
MHWLKQLRDTRGRFTRVVPENLGPVDLPAEAPPVEFSGNYSTCQIYSKGYEFAFMSDQNGTYRQVCTFVYCKDFLHDAVWAMVNKTKWQVYGFKYDTAKDVPLDLDNCVFAFRNTLQKTKPAVFHKRRKACQQFLNQIEAKLGFEPSQIYEVPHEEGPCWLIVGDKGWQHAPPMVGLYTLFIRVGIMHSLGDTADKTLKRTREGKIKIGDSSSYAGNRDSSYIKSAWKGIETILKHGLDIFYEKMADNYPRDLPKRGASLHDAYGPVNFTAGHPKKAMPHWYRDKYWK